ncbi:MAG: aspartyl-tRNA(Asn)/glutamyl-tRNA(Gln) amidotransferase subunit [Patescibacteria group bacterium]|nr:aspartyl-tRNA(Asn)/glutamyl-tRNA(Gln) amidotransferase subunit [Patescibacteria group bacterium]
MIDIKNLTIKKAHEHLKSGDFSVRELVDAYLSEIKSKDKEIHAYIELFSDIDESITRAQKMFENGSATLLTGIPCSIKDNMLYKGHITSSGSKILENYVATYNGTAIQKIIDAGAVILGRTNMDEFAMGSSTEHSFYGPTKNPLDTSRVPGGSSGGAAASVAMDGALFALGSDTGGSICQPASLCGIVGFKPTYGGVSRFGLGALASSLDQIGPFTKSTEDAEIVHSFISGFDPMDSTTITEATRAGGASRTQKKKIGVPWHLFKDGLRADMKENFEKSLENLKKAGYEIVDVELPHAKYALAVYYILLPAEASSNLARYDGVRYGLREEGKDLMDVYMKSRGKGFGKEVRRRIMLGTYVLSHGYYDAYYNKARKLQKVITEEFEKVFETVDAVITPTTPSPAFKFGEKTSDPVAMYLSDVFTVPANIAGIPALTVPFGKSEEGLPLDIHLMGPACGEHILFSIGKDFENVE